MENIELLSPAGDFECLKAAVQNGADSVYFGGNLFNARASAGNFDYDGLKKAIDYCTLRNVKTHLTLNTLIKTSEFEAAVDLAKYAYELGIDAIIVQDFGLAKYLIKNFPDLPIHASTQMSIHNLEGVQEVEKLGFKRAVLARELPINEIEHICKHSQIEIETFIHGALCICYSGQCLFSSVVGGRSGNRGKCAQPCRLPYELLMKVNNTQNVNCIDKGHLLSPKDLCGLSFIPQLIKAGVKCFKIEGRMKTPEYVATVTRIYRKYIDMALDSKKQFHVDQEDIKTLMQVFNRGGFSSGHLDTKPNKELIFKNKPNNMGLYLGNVSHYNSTKGHITINLNERLEIGDTISFEKEPSKYMVSEIMSGKRNLTNGDIGKKVTIGRMKGNISVGNKVYKLSSKSLSDIAKNSYINCENKKISLNCNITIKKDTPIRMKISSNNSKYQHGIYHNLTVNVTSDMMPIAALKTPISVERVIKQISKTNNTPFMFENITVYLDDGLYIPSISNLNELRRKALEELEQQILLRKRRNCKSSCTLQNTVTTKYPIIENPKVSLFLRFLYTHYDYTKLLLHKEKIDKIYLSLKLFFNKDYTSIIQYLSENYSLYVYMPSIVKSNYKNIILNNVDTITQKFNIKGFVISNIGDFKLLENYKKDYDFVGNYSLNVFNTFSLEEYKTLGLNRITLSRELNKQGICEFLSNSDGNEELIVYGNLPVMATNYCFLGKTNKCYPTCGLNCQKSYTYYLKDRLGYKFKIIPDNIQTVTLICNSKTLSIPTQDIPVNYVRVDILDETIEQINDIVDIVYNRQKLEGKNYTNGNLNREV